MGMSSPPWLRDQLLTGKIVVLSRPGHRAEEFVGTQTPLLDDQGATRLLSYRLTTDLSTMGGRTFPSKKASGHESKPRVEVTSEPHGLPAKPAGFGVPHPAKKNSTHRRPL